jgi:hypothetical protein
LHFGHCIVDLLDIGDEKAEAVELYAQECRAKIFIFQLVVFACMRRNATQKY